MSTNQYLIQTRDLTKYYRKHRALESVNLNLETGRIIGLCGPNGSGKTTLIKILMGLLRDYDGDALVGGHPISKESKALCSYLPDKTYFEKNMSGQQAINTFKDMYADFSEDKMLSLLTSFDVSPKLTFKEMSKGMQEKFQLALVLARDAQVYLLDEPIGGVDPASRDKIMNSILTSYAQDSLLLISTHLIQDIESILDEVIFLKDGEVILHENCDELRERVGQSVDGYFREVFR